MPLRRKIPYSRLRWFGHLQRRDENKLNNVYQKNGDIKDRGQEKDGYIKLRWRDMVQEDYREKRWWRL